MGEFMVLNPIFHNMSFLLVEETGRPKENHQQL
jgi:hypothetical protein